MVPHNPPSFKPWTRGWWTPLSWGAQQLIYQLVGGHNGEALWKRGRVKKGCIPTLRACESISNQNKLARQYFTPRRTPGQHKTCDLSARMKAISGILLEAARRVCWPKTNRLPPCEGASLSEPSGGGGGWGDIMRSRQEGQCVWLCVCVFRVVGELRERYGSRPVRPFWQPQGPRPVTITSCLCTILIKHLISDRKASQWRKERTHTARVAAG